MDTSQPIHAGVSEGHDVFAGEASVALWNVNPGVVRWEFMESFVSMREWCLAHGVSWIRELKAINAGSNLAYFRNLAVEQFLDSGHEWMLMIDSDIGYPPDLLNTLLTFATLHDTPIVSANYMLYFDGATHPSMYHKLSPNLAATVMSSQEFAFCLYKLDNGLGPNFRYVDGCGAGCLLVHRELLLKMQANYDPAQPWFANETIHDKFHGEDLTFIDRIRRLGLSVPMVFDLGLRHYKGDTVMIERT